jgi:hypothetical protein
MRSICARLNASNSAWPRVAEPTRTPSTRTTVLFVLEPRMKKPELCPGPPLRTTWMPATRRIRSSTESARLLRIVSASMTTMSAVLRPIASGSRVAVMTTGASELSAAPASIAERTKREEQNEGRARCAPGVAAKGAAPRDGRSW